MAKILDLLLKFVIVVMGLVAIYMLVLKIIGKSPTLIDLISVILVAHLFFTYQLSNDSKRFQGRVEEFMDTTKNSFQKIKEDMDLVKEKLGVK